MRVIEHGKQSQQIRTAAKHERRDEKTQNGSRGAENQMNFFPEPVIVFLVGFQKIGKLCDAEAHHSGNLELKRQKHEKKIRADRANQTDLRKTVYF